MKKMNRKINDPLSQWNARRPTFTVSNISFNKQFYDTLKAY